MIKLSLITPFLIMTAIVTLSNILVQFPINSWLTWGAFSYPISFLITELTNRFFGIQTARKVVYTGFIAGALLSISLATPKIACASGIAFLTSQLLDISIFNRLRQKTWWQAPLIASSIASLIDTAIFWTIAFWGEPLPLLTLALGDFSIKLMIDVAMLLPFRLAINSYLKFSQNPNPS